MDGTPPALPNDLEDVVWALQTAESLWKRGERVDAVVWVRRAAQAAGEGDDARRAATLGRYAADLGEWIGSHAVGGAPLKKTRDKAPSFEALDALLDAAPLQREESQTFVLSSRDVEIVSAKDFEAGFTARAESQAGGLKGAASEGEVMTVSVHAGDVEILEDSEAEHADPFPLEEPTPVKHVKSPLPPAQAPTAAQAHVGMLDPWNESDAARPRSPSSSPFEDEDEVVTSARARNLARPPPSAPVTTSVPAAPRAPNFPVPRRPAPEPPAPLPGDEGDAETTTYRQVNPRARAAEPPREVRSPATAKPKPPAPAPPDARPKPAAQDARPRAPAPPPEPRPKAPSLPTFDKPRPPVPPSSRAPAVPPRPPPPAPSISARPPPPQPLPASVPPPLLDLLELVDSVEVLPSSPPAAEARPKPSLPPNADPLAFSDAPPPPLTVPPVVAALSEPAPPPISGHPTAEPPADLRPEPITAHPTAAALSDLPPEPVMAHPAAGLTISSHPSVLPTPAPSKPSHLPASARPTAPPPGSSPMPDIPAGGPTGLGTGGARIDLNAIEALGDLPDDAREAFAQAATIHVISIEEEVSHFALALVIDGDIDVSATIVDAPALRLSKNDVLRSRGSLVPGVALRLVCNSQNATLATWDDRAVAEAFRTCPWVEDDLRAVTDRVQAKAGVTMGPLGERFDMALREHLTSKLTIRNLSPGEVLVAAGKPVGILIVGIGEIALTNKSGERSGTAGPGDFVFPTQTLGHGSAPETATAGPAGAVVLMGDRATAQELLMTFPPLLEVLATL